jgi:multidrug efflux pump subunit AcrA (membrane-fusion protein)
VTFPRSRRALTILGAVILSVLIVVRLGTMAARSGAFGGGAAAPAAAASRMEVPPPVLTAHGVVQPVARANVATLGGGSVAELSAEVGQLVEKGQVLARVVATNQTELVLAPWRGTVSSIVVRAGDSLLPGAALLTIADLSRYQVETTDVDDYLIGRIRRGQSATVTLGALTQRTIRGRVSSMSTQSQPAMGGAVQYPTVIELPGAADLRPGMSVYVVFEE